MREIREELAAARVNGARLAAEQLAWREHVVELFERALAAGLASTGRSRAGARR
jgi:hypothetical protein